MAGAPKARAAAAAVALLAAGACLVSPFDPAGKACSPPDHSCLPGFECVGGICLQGPVLALSMSGDPAVLAGTCGAGQLSVRLTDGGLPDAPVEVTLDAGGEMRFFSGPGCTQESGTVAVPAFAPDASFSFFALRGGRHQIAATSGANRASLAQDVSPMVRTGRCALQEGQGQVTCPVAPPVLDTGRAFSLFQGTTTEVNSGDAGARCWLAAADALQCDREGISGVVDLQWQVAEVPGASVQTATPIACVGNDVIMPLASPVIDSQTFLLFGEHHIGLLFGTDDFSTAWLADSQTAVVTSAAGCAVVGQYVVQAVQLSGASVDRGVTGSIGLSTATVSVTGLPPAPAARTMLLHTHRYAGDPSGPSCAKMVRGEVVDDTSLLFSRGATPAGSSCYGPNYDVQAVAWERIVVPAGDRLQRLVIDLPSGQTEALVPIAPVDPSRTLVLAGGQGSAGQAFGETGDQLISDQSSAVVALELVNGGTQLHARRALPGGASRWTVHVWELGPSP